MIQKLLTKNGAYAAVIAVAAPTLTPVDIVARVRSVVESSVHLAVPDVATFVRDTNWHVKDWAREAAAVFTRGDLPYRVSEWHDSTGMHVEADSEALYLNGRGGDLLVCVLMGLVLFAARALLNSAVLRPMARSCGLASKSKQGKFSESVAFCLYYVPVFIWGLRLLLVHDLAMPLARLFSHYPQSLYTSELKLYVTLQAGFYVAGLLFLLFLDTRRKDFGQMIVHHLITLALIYLAEYHHYRNMTVIVLVLHDVGDIFLFAAKAFHYIGCKRVVDVLFALFAAVFFVSRLVLFPRVIWSFYSEALDILGDERWDPAAEHYVDYAAHKRVTALMASLGALHVFWFALIARMIARSLAAPSCGIAKDIRSESEDDDDAE